MEDIYDLQGFDNFICRITGTYVDELINIYPGDGEAIYQLHTGNYVKEEQ